MNFAACEAKILPPSPTAAKESSMSGLSFSRPPAPHVPPVTIDGIRYEPTTQSATPGPDHAPGVLGAYDAATGARLWTLKVYDLAIDPRLESDVQEDHFRTLAATSDGKLLIITETGRRYEVDPAKRIARALP